MRSVEITRSLILLLAVAAIPALSGCAQATQETLPQSDGDASTSQTVPGFVGPWADEFTSAYRKATSDFERQVLLDGTVSDDEFSEMEHAFSTCLGDKRIGFTGFKPGGGFDFTAAKGMANDEANRITDDCSATTGVNTVGTLYFQVKQNPENVDGATVMASCLVRMRVVADGYTASDYNRDAPTMSFPFRDETAGQRALETCGTDPLGLLGLGE